MIEDLNNYLPIDPFLATSGQPMRDQFAEIKAAGFETVINLATATSWDAIPEEPNLVNDLGMEYISIPVIWEAPTEEDLQHFFDTMQQNRGRKVWVHCARNYRVSSFVFLYRVLQQSVPIDTAQEDLYLIWEPNEVWQNFIDEHLRSILKG